MSRIFITGSSDGLGLMAAKLLIEQGHSVVLHARSEARAVETHRKLAKAESIVVGDLSRLQQMNAVAAQVNTLGSFDAVIHNAALGYREPQQVMTEDGLSQLFAVNSLAPYVLTALIQPPKRLVYISSELHQQGDTSLRDLNWRDRPWDGMQAYSDSKMHNVLLAFGVPHRWPGVHSNAMTPGWVKTKMGGPGASDDLNQGHRTQAWMAASDGDAAKVSGEYFYHMRTITPLPATHNRELQDRFMSLCAEITGLSLPTSEQ